MSKKELSDEVKSSIKEYFDLFDQNGDGSITAKELHAILEGNGEVVTEEQVDEFIKVHDENGDGQLNLEEFIKWWTAL